MSSKPGSTQSRVTDYYRRVRSRRSPSPKRSKQIVEIHKAPTSARRTPGIISESSAARDAAIADCAPLAPDSVTPQTLPVASLTAATTARTPAITRVVCVPEIVPSLELPATYTLLLNWFGSADQLVSIMYNRQELITFTKLQSGVQKTTRRNFGLQQLGQIKTVYPEAYEYEQVRTTRQAGIMQNRRQDYELTIKPNLLTDLSTYGLQTPVKSPRKRIDVTPTKTPPRTPVKRPYFALSPKRTPPKSSVSATAHLLDSPLSPSKSVPVAGAVKPFTGGRLVARNQVFRRNLFGILRQHHKEFLGSLSPPIKLSDDEERRLTSWHPKFLLDERALEIAVASLPEAPVVEKIACAKDLLGISKAGLHPKVEAAIANITVEVQLESDTNKRLESSAGASTSSKPSLIKGVPPKLLEKIREKERQKKQLAMLRSPEDEAHRLRLSRLPDFVRIINMYFATEAKAVLPLAQVHKKLSDSYASPVTSVEIVEHVKLLRELAPTWISQTELGEKGSYLRVNRELDISEVLKVLGKQ